MEIIKNLFFLCAFLWSAQIYGQDMSAMSSGSSSAQTEELEVEQTLGETFVTTMEADADVTQGFNQPQIEIVGSVQDPLFKEEIGLYPNPTLGILNIEILKNRVPGGYELTIRNEVGENLENKFSQNTSAFETETILDLKNLEPGIYFLTIKRADSNIKKTYKIIRIDY